MMRTKKEAQIVNVARMPWEAKGDALRHVAPLQFSNQSKLTEVSN